MHEDHRGARRKLLACAQASPARCVVEAKFAVPLLIEELELLAGKIGLRLAVQDGFRLGRRSRSYRRIARSEGEGSASEEDEARDGHHVFADFFAGDFVEAAFLTAAPVFAPVFAPIFFAPIFFASAGAGAASLESQPDSQLRG